MKVAATGLLCLAAGLAMAMGTPPRRAAPLSGAAAGTPSTMLKDDDLRASSDAGAKPLGRLAKGAAVRVLASQGGWTRVAANGGSGWVRVLSVRAVAAGATASDLAGLAEAGATPRDPGKVVAVAGVRGLDVANLQAAAYNADEIRLLESYVLGQAEAERFARAAGLSARALPHFESSSPAAGDAPAGGPNWKGIQP